MLVEMQKVDLILDVPCFKCQIRNEVNSFDCDPVKCVSLSAWLPQVKDVLTCPSCSSTRIVRCGFYRHKQVKTQKFQCNGCGRWFNQYASFFKMKTPKKIILFALELNARGCYSRRDISQLIKEKFNYSISHVTVGNWILKAYRKELG